MKHMENAMGVSRGRARPGIAAFAGMMMPGLGYGYAGELRLALGYNLIFMSAIFLVGRFVVPISPVGFWLIALIIVIWYVGSPLSTFIYLRHTERMQASWVMMIASFIIVPVFVFCAIVGMGHFKLEVFGFELLRIDTDMPVLRRGDMVYVSGKEVGEGDMVAYRPQGDDGAVIIRQIYNVTDDTFRTKKVGFGSITLEDIIPRSAIVGRVIKKWSPVGPLTWTAIDMQRNIDEGYVSIREAEALDRELNRSYQQIMASLSADEQIKLRNAERAWINYRDATCQTKAYTSEQWIREKTEGDMEVMCIGRLTRERVEELKRKYPMENR